MFEYLNSFKVNQLNIIQCHYEWRLKEEKRKKKIKEWSITTHLFSKVDQAISSGHKEYCTPEWDTRVTRKERERRKERGGEERDEGRDA